MSQLRLTGSPITITSDSLVINAPIANTGLTFASERLTGPTPRTMAIGYLSGQSLTTGANNTLYGSNSGQAITSGGQNTCLGGYAGSTITTGVANAFTGFQAGTNNTGSYNTGYGYQSTYRGTGDSNTCYGMGSGLNFTTAANNTLIGATSGGGLSTGIKNVFLGGNSGGAVSTGSNNIVIGTDNNDCPATTNNSIRLGASAVHTSCFLAGVTGISQTGPNVAMTVNGSGQVGIGAVSLREKKDDIELIDEVINHEKLMQVKARNYTYKEWIEKIPQHGVIIDEIKPIFPELVGQCHGKDFYVNYEQFIALLIADLQYAWKSMHNLEFRLATLENKTV